MHEFCDSIDLFCSSNCFFRLSDTIQTLWHESVIEVLTPKYLHSDHYSMRRPTFSERFCRQNVANKLFISCYFNPIHPCVLATNWQLSVLLNALINPKEVEASLFFLWRCRIYMQYCCSGCWTRLLPCKTNLTSPPELSDGHTGEPGNKASSLELAILTWNSCHTTNTSKWSNIPYNSIACRFCTSTEKIACLDLLWIYESIQ